MVKIIYTTIAILFMNIHLCTTAQGQESMFEKVSKQYSLLAGYSNITKSSSNNIATTGYALEFDYSWKLSGYNKKKSSYITVPIGYRSYSSSTFNNINILFYGWTVRHNLRKNKKWIPYLSYSLLLNQIWYQNIKGNDMGHQTRFAFGFDRRLNKFSALTLALNYSFIRFPGLDQNRPEKFTTVSVIGGYRFGQE